jgi:hypothetical protein
LRVSIVGERENSVLAKKSGERGTADQGEHPDAESNKSEEEVATLSAHFPNILFMMKRNQDGTGTKEE